MRKILFITVFLLVAPLYAGGHGRSITHSLTKGIVEILNSKTRKDTTGKRKKKNAKKKRIKRKKKN